MKKNILVGLLWLGVLATSSAGIYYQGTGVSGETFEGSVANPTIVDGNPAAVIANLSLYTHLTLPTIYSV